MKRILLFMLCSACGGSTPEPTPTTPDYQLSSTCVVEHGEMRAWRITATEANPGTTSGASKVQLQVDPRGVATTSNPPVVDIPVASNEPVTADLEITAEAMEAQVTVCTWKRGQESPAVACHLSVVSPLPASCP